MLGTRFVEIPPPGVPQELGFSVVPSKKLKANPNARGLGKVLLYSINTVRKSPGEPMFIVAPSLITVANVDREQFAIDQLNHIGTVAPTSLVSKRSVKIDGLPGFEVIAKGEDKETSAPLTIYEVVLYRDDGEFYVLVGVVGVSQADEFLPEFKAMANSFRRTARNAPLGR